MALSPDAVKAYEELEIAIENVMKYHPRTHMSPGTMISGWQLIIGGLHFHEEENLADDDDELDPCNTLFGYARRGQGPIFSRGLIESFLDEFKS